MNKTTFKWLAAPVGIAALALTGNPFVAGLAIVTLALCIKGKKVGQGARAKPASHGGLHATDTEFNSGSHFSVHGLGPSMHV